MRSKGKIIGKNGMQAMEREKCFQSVVCLKKIKHFDFQGVWWL